MQVQQEQIDTVLTKMTHVALRIGVCLSHYRMPSPIPSCQKARFSGHFPTNFVCERHRYHQTQMSSLNKDHHQDECLFKNFIFVSSIKGTVYLHQLQLLFSSLQTVPSPTPRNILCRQLLRTKYVFRVKCAQV